MLFKLLQKNQRENKDFLIKFNLNECFKSISEEIESLINENIQRKKDLERVTITAMNIQEHLLNRIFELIEEVKTIKTQIKKSEVISEKTKTSEENKKIYYA